MAAHAGGGSVPYWQESLTKVVERDRFLLKEGKFTDVVFLVGEEAREFHCHRLYLAKTSPAFESMLYGALASPLGEPIRIPDASPDGFQALLTYIYEGTVELKTFSAASGLLQLSKKYLLPQELQQQCRAQCWALIYPRAVWQAIQFASENQEDAILNTAWQVVFQHTTHCLELHDMCSLPHYLLLQLVQEDGLNCYELDLYQACVYWGKEEVVRRGLPESEQGLRTALADILPHIRFLTMDNEDLAVALKPPRFVTDREALNLFLLNNSEQEAAYVEEAEEALGGFSLCKEPRVSEPLVSFQVEGCPPALLHYPADGTSFNFYTNTTLAGKHGPQEFNFVGLVLPSQLKNNNVADETYEEEVTVFVYNTDTSRPVCKSNFKCQVPYNSTFDVVLTTALSRSVAYTVVTVLHKTGTYPLVQGDDGVTYSSATAPFRDSIFLAYKDVSFCGTPKQFGYKVSAKQQ